MCVDQRSDAERNLQVSCVLKIYQRAVRMLVWAGQSDGGTASAFALIEDVASLDHN